jgi:hypothetical protein
MNVHRHVQTVGVKAFRYGGELQNKQLSNVGPGVLRQDGSGKPSEPRQHGMSRRETDDDDT